MKPHPILPGYYADESQRRRFLTRMFNETAAHYDQINGIMAFGWGTDDAGLRTVPVATLRERFDAARLDTRYYTPELHVASFALPRFIGEIVEDARDGSDQSVGPPIR